MSISKKDLQFLRLKKQQEEKDLFLELASKNHKIPKTRREFLAHGLIGAASTLALPTLSQLISSSAWGADQVVCDGAATSYPAFIHLQLAGGAALFANYLQCGAFGNPINGETMGVGALPSSEPLFANSAPFWEKSPLVPESDTADGSHFIRGMRRRINAILAGSSTFENFIGNAGFCAIASESQDDATTNKQEISGMLKAAGITGSVLPYLLTDFIAPADELFSSAGSRFMGAVLPSSNFLNVVNAGSLKDSLGFSGVLAFNGISTQQKLLQAINDLSRKQVEALARAPSSHETQRVFQGLIKCSTQKNVDVLNTGSIVDIKDAGYAFPGAAAIWAPNLTGVHAMFNPIVEKVGLTVSNCLSGLSGAAVINLGGYDYHLGRLRQRANEKDREAGDIVGRILATARLMNKKVFIFISTDGSTFTPPTSDTMIAWQNDSSKKGTSYMIGYNPNGVPTMQGHGDNASFQLNYFTGNGEVNPNHPVASVDNQEIMASAVFLNYLSFANALNILDTKPALKPVKDLLTAATPSGFTVADYFTRFKPG